MGSRGIKITVVIVLIVLMVFSLLGFLLSRQDTAPPKQEQKEPEQAVKLEEESETVASKPGPVIDSPALHGDHADAIANDIEDTGAVVSRVDDGIHTLVYPYEERHPEIPMVEFRFQKRTPDGERKKACVTTIRVMRREDGVTKRIRPPSEDIHFEGGVDLRGTDNKCVHGFRIGAGPQGAGNRLMAFGRRYHMIFRVIDPDRESMAEYEEYESIVQIPEHIAEGKMAVIDLFAETSAGSIPKRREKEEVDDRGEIEGEITQPLPPTDTSWRVAYNHPEGDVRMTGIEEDGRFEFEDRKLGGMLHIAQMGAKGVTWMVVDEVDERYLRLPEDADRVISRDSIYTATIKIPQEHINEDFIGVWIMKNKSDSCPVAAASPKVKVSKFERFKSSGKLKMEVVPGRYWIKAFYDPGEVEEREWKTLGQVTVPKEDSEEDIRIQTQ